MLKIHGRHVILTLTLCLAACADYSTDIATDFRETPLRALRGVTMEMTARQLRIARPNIRFVPAAGYQEIFDDHEVVYSFPPGAIGERETEETGRARVSGVFLTRSFASPTAADAFWRDVVSKVTAAHRAPEQCEQISGSSAGMQARWATGSTRLTIGSFKPIDGNSRRIADRVIVAVMTTNAFKLPEGTTPVACPTP